MDIIHVHVRRLKGGMAGRLKPAASPRTLNEQCGKRSSAKASKTYQRQKMNLASDWFKLFIGLKRISKAHLFKDISLPSNPLAHLKWPHPLFSVWNTCGEGAFLKLLLARTTAIGVLKISVKNPKNSEMLCTKKINVNYSQLSLTCQSDSEGRLEYNIFPI